MIGVSQRVSFHGNISARKCVIPNLITVRPCPSNGERFHVPAYAPKQEQDRAGHLYSVQDHAHVGIHTSERAKREELLPPLASSKCRCGLEPAAALCVIASPVVTDLEPIVSAATAYFIYMHASACNTLKRNLTVRSQRGILTSG